jgi:hypothetical protein
MAIVLERIAAPGATPIAYNAASSVAFGNNYFKVSQAVISEQDRKTIIILGMAYELASRGGANYKGNFKALRQDAMVYTGGISNLDLNTARAAIAWSIGNSLDATLPSDLSSLMGITPKTDQCPTDELDRMIAFLYAQLGV